MKIIKTIEELKEFRSSLNGNVGFVPTMGALHDGHKSLIQKSVDQNDHTIVSVFVNPTQFLPGEDLEKYPRKEEDDIKICETCGASAIFIPDANIMYSDKEPLVLAPNKFANILEGKTRPGHFDGVLRVLTKFFNLVKPNRAYFGKKDTQQLLIIQNYINTMFLDIEIIPCDIVRESDGLALSSRNAYLSEEEKCMALRISKSLQNALNFVENGDLDSRSIKEEMLRILEPLKLDYVAIVNKELEEIQKVEEGNTIILVAAYVGKTRLIDNMWI
ncbi:pantoate--beta-alanine ligase [Campylobacter pinnipediorum]|uniref:pantoate--beta-alanine ligase n=1 Tax=Campylobacter pinnipediorum TaxID=1965231 RepID=UPI00084D73E7|nr:pantoate--beta-alanine ligase [Campylobacter pinnipediorum]